MATVYDAQRLHHGGNTDIRLLHLHPATAAEKNTPITCNLLVVSLEKAPAYSALSYVWGVEAATKTIILDGQPFAIRTNLWDFLIQHRQSGREGYLWIDALCINQSSIPERNHQVAIMGKIYSQATLVIAWLGAGPESLIHAVDELSNVDYEEKSLTRLVNLVKRGSAHAIHEFDSFLQYLVALSNSEYWSRMWVIQECVLSSDLEIQCGKAHLDGENLYDMLRSSVFLSSDSNSVFPALSAELLKDWRWWSDSSFLMSMILDTCSRKQARHVLGYYDVLKRFSHFPSMCLDPRDRIYGLIGLIDPQDLEKYQLYPDYAMSASELYFVLCNRGFELKGTEAHRWMGQEGVLQRILQLPKDDENVKLIDNLFYDLCGKWISSR